MRTTLDIDDQLLVEVKIYALRNNLTLKELITKLLEKEMKEKSLKSNKEHSFY